MTNRHKDALRSQDLNPPNLIDTAGLILEACRECEQEGVNPHSDPAVRLLAMNVAYLCGSEEMLRNDDQYSIALAQCEAGAIVEARFEVQKSSE